MCLTIPGGVVEIVDEARFRDERITMSHSAGSKATHLPIEGPLLADPWRR